MHPHLLLGLLLALDVPTPSAEADVSSEGVWVVEAQWENGEATNFDRGLLLRFRDGNLRTSAGGAATYTVLSTDRPRAVDLRTRQGTLLSGIYQDGREQADALPLQEAGRSSSRVVHGRTG